MRIFIKAKPGSKKEKIEKVDENHFIVAVKEPPVDGKANEAIVRVLSEYFKIPKSQVRIISGQKSRQKIIEIDGY